MHKSGLTCGMIAAFLVALAAKAVAQPFSGDWTFGTGDAVVIHVSAECGNDDWTGRGAECVAPDGPKRTIQAGINAARTGDTVLAADGRYTGLGNKGLWFPPERNSTLRSENGPENCIIDLQNDGLAFFFVADEPPEAVVDGFTITNGNNSEGGAIYFHHHSRVIINNCILTGNTAPGGGAIACDNDSNPTIINCMITGNTAAFNGGAVFTTGESTPTFINCTITENTAVRDGGAVFLNGFRGAGPTFINCTIAENTAGREGGAIFTSGFKSGATVTNSIIWDNSGDQITDPGGDVIVRFTDVQGGFVGQGNIDDDPLFVDPDNEDYHIASGSPAINTGDPAFTAEPGDTDIDGQKRVWNGRVDMGSDEFGSFAFGDVNCDGTINAFDIEPFLLALFEPDEYAERFPDCDIELADANADGAVDAFDIESFIDLLFP